MKKVFLLVVVMMIFQISATAEEHMINAPRVEACFHENLSERVAYSNWRHLVKGQSDVYATEHCRDVYMIEHCNICHEDIGYYFVTTEFGDHTLPCSLCGAR